MATILPKGSAFVHGGCAVRGQEAPTMEGAWELPEGFMIKEQTACPGNFKEYRFCPLLSVPRARLLCQGVLMAEVLSTAVKLWKDFDRDA